MVVTGDAATQHEIDLDRHAGLDAPEAPIPKPQLGDSFEVDDTILKGAYLCTAISLRLLRWTSNSSAGVRNEVAFRFQLWNVFVGPYCEADMFPSRWESDQLLLEGRPS